MSVQWVYRYGSCTGRGENVGLWVLFMATERLLKEAAKEAMDQDDDVASEMATNVPAKLK